jgi:hypothetical protein
MSTPMTQKKTAVFTIIQNEDFFLKIWTNYYSKSFPNEDIYILNHDSTTPTCLNLLKELKDKGFNIIPVHRSLSFDHCWLRTTVEHFQRYLLQSYDNIVFAEVDEIITPNPNMYKGNLAHYVMDKLGSGAADVIRPAGFNVEHVKSLEPALDLSKPVLIQRSKWRRTFIYDKPVISKVPCKWVNGFHSLATDDKLPTSIDSVLIHLHKFDYDLCKNKHAEQAKRRWSTYDLETGQGEHNRVFDGIAFDKWFFGGNPHQVIDNNLCEIPEHFKGIV